MFLERLKLYDSHFLCRTFYVGQEFSFISRNYFEILFCAIQTLKHFPDKIYPYFFNYPISSPSNLQRINWWYFIFFGLITHTSNAMHCLYCFDNRKPSIKCDKFWAMFILRLVRENFIKSVSRRCWSCAPLLVAKNN